MSWLVFGVGEGDRLIPIEETRRGATDLKCPYCGGEGLIARKGKVMAWHFAHSGESCRQTSGDRELPVLPYYNRFDLSMAGKYHSVLCKIWANFGDGLFSKPVHCEVLKAKGCIELNSYKQKWQLTKLGKLAVGALSLNLFNQLQRPQIVKRLQDLENAVIEAKRKGTAATLADALTDLRLYLAQYKRTLNQTLYFLEIQADEDKFHKIGVTEREVSDRIPEIRTDLAKHYQDIKIKILKTFPHRGNVEPYFKYRYRDCRKAIGNHTEYFYFGDDLRNVKSDLSRMKPRALSKVEEKMLATNFSTVKRSLLVKAGMKDGRKAGRAKEKPYQTLIKHPTVVEALENGLSLRKASQETGVAINTVRRVKAAMEFTGVVYIALDEEQQEAIYETFRLVRNQKSEREIYLEVGISSVTFHRALRGEEIEQESFNKLIDWWRYWRPRR